MRLVSWNRHRNQRIRPPETSGRLRLIANRRLVLLSYSVGGGYQGLREPPQPNSSGNNIDVGDTVYYTRRYFLMRSHPLAGIYEMYRLSTARAHATSHSHNPRHQSPAIKMVPPASHRRYLYFDTSALCPNHLCISQGWSAW